MHDVRDDGKDGAVAEEPGPERRRDRARDDDGEEAPRLPLEEE